MEIPIENELLAARIFGPAHRTADETRIQFDWVPSVVDGHVTFLVSVTRGHRRNSNEFEVDRGRLSPSQEERLHNFLAARHAGIDTALNVALATAWLLDVSLVQQQPELSKLNRDLRVRELLLVHKNAD